MSEIYFDHAATTPMHPKVIQEMLDVMTNDFGNPSSIHQFGRQTRKILDDSRKVFADSVGAKEDEILLTSGGTESDNTAIIETALSRQHLGKHIITTKIEHQAVLQPMAYLASLGFEITYLPVNKFGELSIETVTGNLRPDTILVSIMYGNNEVGTKMPIYEVGQLLAEHQAYFHTDAIQAYGTEEIAVHKMQIDLLSVSAHKVNGPKGIGFLYINENISLPPFVHGGEQENKRRGGTENVSAIAGFAEAVKLLTPTEKKARKAHEYSLRNYLLASLSAVDIDYEINGLLDEQKSLPHILNLWIKGIKNDLLIMNLDLAGIAVSSGSACTAGNVDPSHVLVAMFGKDSPRISESVRISFGAYSTVDEVDKFVSTLQKVTAKLKAITF